MDLQVIENKLKTNQVNKLSEKEIDYFIDEHWLEWTCKYELSPCGDLTLIGKREYIQDNLDEILSLIKEFPSEISMTS